MKKENIYISLFIIIILIIPILVIGFLFNIYSKKVSYDNYDTISEYVNKNHKILTQIANEYIKRNEVEKPRNVTSINVHGANEIYVKNDNTIVEFDMDAKGLVPSATYYGFYYSKNNIPATFQNGDEKLIQYKMNSWKWTGVGDNNGKTIKIRDNWFYFEASF